MMLPALLRASATLASPWLLLVLPSALVVLVLAWIERRAALLDREDAR